MTSQVIPLSYQVTLLCTLNLLVATCWSMMGIEQRRTSVVLFRRIGTRLSNQTQWMMNCDYGKLYLFCAIIYPMSYLTLKMKLMNSGSNFHVLLHLETILATKFTSQTQTIMHALLKCILEICKNLCSVCFHQHNLMLLIFIENTRY